MYEGLFLKDGLESGDVTQHLIKVVMATIKGRRQGLDIG